MALKRILTITSSDTSAGAGMQADLGTFQELNTYGMVALTAVVAMDKETWPHDTTPLPVDVFERQLGTVISVGPDATKTGMLGTEETTKRAGEAFERSDTKYFIVDPVMVCKGEDEVLNPGSTDAMIKYLLPKATIVAPNLFEIGQLPGLGKLTSTESMRKATKVICDQGAQHIIIKGGEALNQDKSCDLYYDNQIYYQLTTNMFQQSCNHGAGYTFVAATTAYLANGKSPKEAAISARAFVASATKNSWKVGGLVGSVDHGAYNRVEHIDANVKEV